jgi:hypothetical protein
LQGTYESLQEASAAASKLRNDKQRFVTIRTGLHDKDYFGNAAPRYEVYYRGRRCGNLFLHATTDSAAQALAIGDKLGTIGERFEVVNCYGVQ